MANPKLEDGFVRIANEIMDNLTRTRIPGEARQVLDFIIRQTYGYNQKAAAITLKEFSDSTGLTKVHVIKAINKLIAMNLISVTQKGNDSLPKKVTLQKVFEFNKDYETWKSLPKKVTLPKKATAVTQKGNDSLPKKVTNVTQKGNAVGRKPLPDGNPQTPKDKRHKDIIKRSRNTFLPNAPAYRLAALLFDEIIKANPLSRLKALDEDRRENKIQEWALHTDRLMRLDGQEPSIVEEVILFAVNDGFWGTNILSTAKLRYQYDRLVKEMQHQGKMPGQKHVQPGLFEGKRFIAKGGLIERFDEGSRKSISVFITPERVMELFRVNLEECIVAKSDEILETKGIDVSRYIILRPQPDGIYDLQRLIQQQQGRACA